MRNTCSATQNRRKKKGINYFQLTPGGNGLYIINHFPQNHSCPHLETGIFKDDHTGFKDDHTGEEISNLEQRNSWFFGGSQ
ncbi:MAG: hypothetical protein ABUT20_32345 [Bacteroidota bacterium]